MELINSGIYCLNNYHNLYELQRQLVDGTHSETLILTRKASEFPVLDKE